MIGSGGSGKTTVARALAQRTGLPLIHLDALYWRAGWQPTPPDDWRAKVQTLISRDTWIIDGNYGGPSTLGLKRVTPLCFSISHASFVFGVC